MNTSYLSPKFNLVDLSVSTDTGLLIPVPRSDKSGSVLKADERASELLGLGLFWGGGFVFCFVFFF